MLARTLLLVSLSCSTLFAQDSDALLRKIDDHYNHLSSLRARYSEHYAGMGMDKTESGTLVLKKPGRMRWTYDQPAGKVFVSAGTYAAEEGAG
jgi:outer membrane lipoprotein carrier protein